MFTANNHADTKRNFFLKRLFFLLIPGLCFAVSSLSFIIIAYIFSGDILIILFEWTQLIALLFFLLIIGKKFFKPIVFPSLFLVFFLYFILVMYHIVTDLSLDFSLVKRNFWNLLPILDSFLFFIFLALILALINAVFLINLKINNSKLKRALIIISILIISTPFILPNKIPTNEVLAFVKTIYKRDRVMDLYTNFYNGLLSKSTAGKKNILNEAEKLKTADLPVFADNIIILQLESLDAELVNSTNTPNFFKLAQTNIFFPKFYGNSVQTLLGQENILCSLPTSLDYNLVQSKKDKEILCLPKILKAAGYKTFFIKSYNLNFTRTGEFMKNIGFSEVHADDIMQSTDPKYNWGYREDVFHQRAIDFFAKNHGENRNFAYIEIGPTNHWPFKTQQDYNGVLPFPKPKNHSENMANTTHIQDSYLAVALKKINKLFPKNNYTLLILGDHAWPLGIHTGNTFNQENAYEENFLTSLAVKIGSENKYQNKIINTRYSSMDIMPSLLDLIGIKYPENSFRRSFVEEINNKKTASKKIILIQPFGDKYINIIDWPEKYQYKEGSEQLIKYNLLSDPNESRPVSLLNNQTKIFNSIKNLLK